MRTQVAIIGAGPAGLLLGQLLHLRGIDNIILEQRDRAYVLGRVRAGVLERGTMGLLHEAQVAQRMEKHKMTQNGFGICFDDEYHYVSLKERTEGQTVAIYGQTQITEDLIEARDTNGAPLVFEAANVALHDLESDTPHVTYELSGTQHSIHCDYVAGCDGFHGISRQTIPASILRTYSLEYPLGWLGLLTETPPLKSELTYVHNPRGYALCSIRSPTRSRYYLQVAADEDVNAWSDDRFWQELSARLPRSFSSQLQTGPSLEKSVAPLRSFVAEPMRFGRLFLAGDAAHIVPPTGAKGLNLAASDIHYLSRALIAFYASGTTQLLDGYSDTALKRIWKAERFSWWMTKLLHVFDSMNDFEKRVQHAELAYLISSPAAQRSLAENYIGLPY